MARYTQKQIDKYQRQKYITELEKLSKNLFRMFRDQEVTAEMYVTKFQSLKEKLDEKEEILLDSEYLKELKGYIERLFQECCLNEAFDDERFSEIREVEMSQLNRLQKMKNRTSYKKEKHKAKHQNEDWG
ncbi:MAG TPA: hypothetical protein ENK71_00615 [Epsilonproteobacteria bacterium]|nr:hypothetical protein [Campylobacterota bacterium]